MKGFNFLWYGERHPKKVSKKEGRASVGTIIDKKLSSSNLLPHNTYNHPSSIIHHLLLLSPKSSGERREGTTWFSTVEDACVDWWDRLHFYVFFATDGSRIELVALNSTTKNETSYRSLWKNDETKVTHSMVWCHILLFLGLQYNLLAEKQKTGHL